MPRTAHTTPAPLFAPTQPAQAAAFFPTTAMLDRYAERRAEYEEMPLRGGIITTAGTHDGNPERAPARNELQLRAALLSYIILGEEAEGRARRNPNVTSLQTIIRTLGPQAAMVRTECLRAADELLTAITAPTPAPTAPIDGHGGEDGDGCAFDAAAAAAADEEDALAEDDAQALDYTDAAPLIARVEAANAAADAGGDDAERDAREMGWSSAAELQAEPDRDEDTSVMELIIGAAQPVVEEELPRPAGGALVQEVLAELAAADAAFAPETAQDDASRTKAGEAPPTASTAPAPAPFDLDAAITAAVDARLAPFQARLETLEAAMLAPMSPSAAPAPALPRTARSAGTNVHSSLADVRFHPVPDRANGNVKYITVAMDDAMAAPLDELANDLGISRVNLARLAMDLLLTQHGRAPVFTSGLPADPAELR